MRQLGIDVSHFQNTAAPAGVLWSTIAQKCSFAIIRATYGSSKDSSAPAHVKNARAAGLQVGLYHFFRSTQSLQDQLDAFCAQAITCGIGKGDIAPALDIEDDLTAKLEPAWEANAHAFVTGLISEFGEAMVYTTQRDFGRLGKPSWVLDRPLWVAHYTAAAAPATPGNKPCAIWQRRVGPYQPDGPGGAIKPMLLDQNVADGALPLCTMTPSAIHPPVAPPAPDNHDDVRALRVEAQIALALHTDFMGNVVDADGKPITVDEDPTGAT